MSKRPGETFLRCPNDEVVCDRRVTVHEVAAKRIADTGFEQETWSWKVDVESLVAADGEVSITIKFLDGDGFELGTDYQSSRLAAGHRHVFTGTTDQDENLSRKFVGLGCEVELMVREAEAMDVPYREVVDERYLDQQQR